MSKYFCCCVLCKSEVGTNVLNIHYDSKNCRGGGKYIPMNSCPYCGVKKSILLDDFANHVKWCEKNPKKDFYDNRKGTVYPTGRNAWNKGLTKAENESLRSSSDKLKSKYSNGELVPTGYFGLTKEQRSIRAKSQGFGGYRENAGRSKKFRITDSYGNSTCLQSSFELKCSEILNDLSIKWIRPKALKYDGRNYFADFYLIDYDIYLDPKNNYKAKLDKEKIEKVIEQNNVKLFVLLEEQITEEFIGGLTQLARVAS